MTSPTARRRRLPFVFDPPPVRYWPAWWWHYFQPWAGRYVLWYFSHRELTRRIEGTSRWA